MLVPLSCMYALVPDPARWSTGYLVTRYEPAASSDTILLPGAATAGFIVKSYLVGPRELYVAIVSSLRFTVPAVLTAPTVIANGELPGDVTPPRMTRPSGDTPLLPAAATTTMPAAYARATASHNGS